MSIVYAFTYMCQFVCVPRKTYNERERGERRRDREDESLIAALELETQSFYFTCYSIHSSLVKSSLKEYTNSSK